MNARGLVLTLTATFVLSQAVLAENLRGQVYRITSEEVILQVSPSTLAKVPVENAVFRLHGEEVRADRLIVGQHVQVDCQPRHGFQRYYHTSSDLEGSQTVFILTDAHPDDLSVVEWDGDLYRPIDP